MRKKCLISLIVLGISIGLIACKSDESVITENSSEIVEETQINETDLGTVSEVETETAMVETENVEVIEQVSEPSWYMDAEGVKNKDLGISVKRDNGIFEEIELVQNVGVFTPYESGGGTTRQNVFKCRYYDGDFDSYISEHEMQKENVNGIEYAYKEHKVYDEEEGKEIVQSVDIAMGGNGIIIYSQLHTFDFQEGEEINDYLSRIDLIKTCDDFSLDCMAYITEEGLYCPILGICLSIVETEHCMNRISLSLAKNDYTASITITDESIQGMGAMSYMTETNGAQEIVDKFVEGLIEPDEYQTLECVAIDGTAEVNIGINDFLGRGVVSKYEWDESGNEFEEWLFYSDNSTWSISFDYDKQDGISYESYLSVFEVLE